MYKIILLLILFGTTIVAQTIDQQIQEIKQAPSTTRVVLMNAFKQRLSSMNREERLEAIQSMRSHSSTQHTQHSGNTQHRVSHMQMNNNADMSNFQRTNQNQAGSHVAHELPNIRPQKDGAQLPNFMPQRR